MHVNTAFLPQILYAAWFNGFMDDSMNEILLLYIEHNFLRDIFFYQSTFLYSNLAGQYRVVYI